jgi:hypothetical protein
MRQDNEMPPNSERHNSHLREEEKQQSVEVINSHQMEIKEMIGKMSVDIDD